MPHHASTQIDHTQESLRGGVPPFNGGAGGRNPQIRVLPSLIKLETHWYITFAAPLSTTTYDP
jgi:hypothetical protein